MATAMEMEQPHANAEQQDEQLLLELTDVELTYGGKANAEGTGTLRISSRRVSWVPAAAAAAAQGQGQGQGEGGFEVEVPCVTLHAISKDPSSFPKPCLYCQITEGDEEDEDDEDAAGGVEVFFAPKDPESLPALFEAMSKAALLNPDPPEPGAEEGDDELIYDQAGLDLAGCTEEQAAMLGRLDALMNFAPGLGGAGAAGGDGSNGLAAVAAGQFDDAEDEEEHGEGGEQGANEHGATVGQGEDELPQ